MNRPRRQTSTPPLPGSLAATIRQQIERLKALVAVPDLKSLQSEKLRGASEELIVMLQTAAPKVGLRAPSLEEIAE